MNKSYVQIQIPKWGLVFAITALVLVIFGTGFVFAQAMTNEADIGIVFDDGNLVVYADRDFGARFASYKGGDLKIYCPCENGLCPVKPVEEQVPSEGVTPTPGITPELTPTPSKEPTKTPKPSPTPTIEPTPTKEPTKVPTIAPTKEPTVEPQPQNCNNGLGNGPDCPPPGHDKDGDGEADGPKGDNDDDNNNRPCGDPGNPCNNKGGKKQK